MSIEYRKTLSLVSIVPFPSFHLGQHVPHIAFLIGFRITPRLTGQGHRGENFQVVPPHYLMYHFSSLWLSFSQQCCTIFLTFANLALRAGFRSRLGMIANTNDWPNFGVIRQSCCGVEAPPLRAREDLAPFTATVRSTDAPQRAPRVAGSLW